ncbi:uncharacterized protein RSE6_09051 [Rhynchosporium secalis]|uniref:3'-5' exonuclease domain-containing protein n=1 Tax=Rhynchosporium secalis TaxID=38038 RepID=A0A1E1MH42_RHYSE|nr:uncharacterized protein RSE6_09051 [Rhynchosporium secalis]
MNPLPNASATSAQSNTTFTDSKADLLSLLDCIVSVAVAIPLLYIGLEGFDLGLHGSISILSLHIAPINRTYLIDVHALGGAAFSTTNGGGVSLKTVLESATISKVVFDIRNVSHALFSLFQISVNSIKDLQLMELATRTGSRELVSSLAICIEKDSPTSAAAKSEWYLTKERYNQLVVPERGGCYQTLNKRPPKPEIIQYCRQSVVLLPGLYDVYNTKLRQLGQAFWRIHLRDTTNDRVKLSQSPGYDGSSKGFALGWNDHIIETEIESWNEELMMEAQAGTHVLNENDEWVPAPNYDLEDFLDEVEEEDQYYNDDGGKDMARDCIGWEEDMIKNGEPF